MPIAYNDKTGEALRLDDSGAWSPTKLATNPKTGERLALDGAQWVPVKKPEMGWGEYADNLVRQVANGVTFGFADEIAAGLGAATGIGGKFGDYGGNLAAQRGQDKAFEAQYPAAATTAQVGGGILGAVGAGKLVGAAGRAIQGAEASPQIVKNVVTAAENTPQLAKYAGGGAVAGGLSGAGFADGDLEDRAIGAATGGVIGGALGTVLPVAVSGVGKVVGAATRPVTDRIGQGPARVADRKVAQAFERDGKTVDEVSARLRTLGPEATIADAAGENTAGLLETVANQPGTGRQMAQRVLQQRQKGAGGRIQDAAARELGDGGFYQTLDDLNAARKEAAAPLYDEAYKQKFMWNDDIERLITRPSMKQALSRAHRIAAEEGRDPTGLGLGMNEAGDVVFTKVPSMQTLDYVKRGLDDVLEGFRDTVTGKLRLDESGRAINATRAEFVRNLRSLNPAYSEALDAWGGPTQLMDAMAKGRNFSRPDAEITEKIVGALSPAEKEAFLLGVRRGIDDMVDSTGRTSDATRKLLGTPKMSKALQAAFPDTASYRRFAADLLREQKFNQTRNTVLSNSATARRLAGQEDVGIDPSPLSDIAQGIGNTSPLQVAKGAANFVRGAISSGKQLPEGQARELAKMLLSTDREAQTAALQRLSSGTKIVPLSEAQRKLIASSLVAGASQQSAMAINR